MDRTRPSRRPPVRAPSGRPLLRLDGRFRAPRLVRRGDPPLALPRHDYPLTGATPMPSFLPSFRPGIEWIDSMALSPTPLVRTLHGSFPMQSPADATPNLDAMEPEELQA